MRLFPVASARLDLLRFHLLMLLRLSYPTGFCHSCQRPTEWQDDGPAYRCRHCGADPLHHAEG